MRTRRQTLAVLGAAALSYSGCLGRDGGGGATLSHSDGDSSLSLSSPAFAEGESIPVRFTCEGENVSPPLRVEGIPDEAGALALVVDDPDAPGSRPFVHWLLWNLPPDVGEIPEDVPRGETVTSLDDARQGTNDADVVGYAGPCPPPKDGPHTYRFTLHALASRVTVEGGAKRGELADAVEGSVLASARFTAEFDRN